MTEIVRGRNLLYLSKADVIGLGLSRQTILDRRNPTAFELPQTTGLLCVNDVETGVPVCVMDSAWLTAMRTPAVTVLMAKLLHPAARRFGMFGAGVQGREHVLFAAHHLTDLEEILVYDRLPEVAHRLVEEIQPGIDIPIRVGESVERVVKECEVLSSATIVLREPLSIAKDEWVSAGQTILPCDLNTFWAPGISLRADAYIVDSTEEHDLFVEMGYYPGGSPRITAETGEVLAGLAPGRTNSDQLIVNSNIGMAVVDIAVASAIHEAAVAASVGVVLDL